MSNEVYTLNGLEVELLKRASQSEGIRLVWFKNFAINISFIQSVYKTRDNVKQLKSPMKELSEEEREKGLRKLEELRNKVTKKDY